MSAVQTRPWPPFRRIFFSGNPFFFIHSTIFDSERLLLGAVFRQWLCAPRRAEFCFDKPRKQREYRKIKQGAEPAKNMNKFIAAIFLMFAAQLAGAADLENLAPQEYARLEEKIFFEADLGALEALAFYNEYFSRDEAAPLYSAMFYYIGANLYKPQLILKSAQNFKKFFGGKNVDIASPLKNIGEIGVENFGECLAKDFLRQFKSGREDKKFAGAKIQKTFFENNGKNYNFSLNSAHELNGIEKKYLPVLALRGNIEAVKILNLASAKEGSAYPLNLQIIWSYAYYILSNEAPDVFFNFANMPKTEEEIFLQGLPSALELESEGCLVSSFILYHRYLNEKNFEAAAKHKTRLEKEGVDGRLLKRHKIARERIVPLANME